MDRAALDSLLAGVKAQMEAEGLELPPEAWAEFAEAMSHPEAVERTLEILAREEASVRQGDAAPDFALRRLDSQDRSEMVRLSDHFGRRPVALIFGSYT